MSLGIGPEISESVKNIYTAAKVRVMVPILFAQCPEDSQVPIEWEEVSVAPILKNGKTVIPDVAITSVKKNTVALKGTLFCSCSQTCRLTPLFCRPACHT